MSDSEATAIKIRVVFICGDRSFTVRDVIDAALSRRTGAGVEKFAPASCGREKVDEQDLEFDDDAIDAAAERFRYDHDLITAEETEQWLTGRGLVLDDFSGFFLRHFWGQQWDDVEPAPIDYLSAPNDMRELLSNELILSGELNRMAQRLTGGRVPLATAERPVDPLLADEETRFFDPVD